MHCLRGVLYGPPYKIRTPEELVKHGSRLGDAVLQAVAVELARKGQPALTDDERRAWLTFLATHATGSASTTTNQSSVREPVNKMRVVAAES